jgi:hypothetical protein
MSAAPKKLLTTDKLEGHLEEQIDFLKLSAEAFDRGFTGEAKRLAVTLRVLLQDTNNSKSLLGQLGKKNLQFFDTTYEPRASNMMPYHGLVGMVLKTGARAAYRAPLDDRPHEPRQIPFDPWWTNAAIVDVQGRKISRKDLILTAANQDGGAHVDPGLDERYAELAEGSGLGFMSVSADGRKLMQGAERAAIRQIAHEVLKTLIPGYSKKPTDNDVAVSIEQPSVMVVPQSWAKTGRNEKCPCGSDKKYKKCHGRI